MTQFQTQADINRVTPVYSRSLFKYKLSPHFKQDNLIVNNIASRDLVG